MTLNYLVWAFVKPSQWILFGSLVALVCWRWPFGRRTAVATVVLVIVIGLMPIGSLMIRTLESRFAIPANLGRVDGIIVLAGAEIVPLSEHYAQPQLSQAGDRYTTFLALAAAHPEARLVHSGSLEADVARQVIVGAGIQVHRLTVEDGSANTCESGARTHALLAPRPGDRWLLVTSASHMPRAVGCFRAAGWSVIPYPTDFRKGARLWHFDLVDNLENFDTAVHEWVGLIYYRFRGWTTELLPAPATL